VDMDETDYLLQSTKNKEMLLKSLHQATEGETVTVSLDELTK
jgi:PHD/YefM family antitoxin component YafN of YafNO toxin-antitoxin module